MVDRVATAVFSVVEPFNYIAWECKLVAACNI
jgi:hypothetical protein